MCAKAGVPLPPSLMPALAPEKKEEKVVQKTAKETIMELTEVRAARLDCVEKKCCSFCL